jgi:hypothetical protein
VADAFERRHVEFFGCSERERDMAGTAVDGRIVDPARQATKKPGISAVSGVDWHRVTALERHVRSVDLD